MDLHLDDLKVSSVECMHPMERWLSKGFNWSCNEATNVTSKVDCDKGDTFDWQPPELRGLSLQFTAVSTNWKICCRW